jgi:hypothetical protein
MSGTRTKSIKRRGVRDVQGVFAARRNHQRRDCVVAATTHPVEDIMGFGKGALLWLIGIPLPIILLLALFWR